MGWIFDGAQAMRPSVVGQADLETEAGMNHPPRVLDREVIETLGFASCES